MEDFSSSFLHDAWCVEVATVTTTRSIDDVTEELHTWGRRFVEYARGEIRWLKALEHHPQRTWNIAQAALVLVPIAVTATYFLGNRILSCVLCIEIKEIETKIKIKSEIIE